MHLVSCPYAYWVLHEHITGIRDETTCLIIVSRYEFSVGPNGWLTDLVAMRPVFRTCLYCNLSFAGGRRPLLAVANDKGKITILQLASLFRNIDSSKRRLTLPVSQHQLSVTPTHYCFIF